MKHVTCRKATLADFPRLMQLQTAAFSELGRDHYSDRQVEAILMHAELLTPNIIVEGHYFVFVTANDRIVASAGWSRQTPEYERMMEVADHGLTANQVIVRSVYVHPDYARQGLGSRIMKVVEEDAFTFGFTDLVLTATLPGVPLYRHLGYQSMGWSSATLADGTVLQLLAMRKLLAQLRGAETEMREAG